MAIVKRSRELGLARRGRIGIFSKTDRVIRVRSVGLARRSLLRPRRGGGEEFKKILPRGAPSWDRVRDDENALRRRGNRRGVLVNRLGHGVCYDLRENPGAAARGLFPPWPELGMARDCLLAVGSLSNLHLLSPEVGPNDFTRIWSTRCYFCDHINYSV